MSIIFNGKPQTRVWDIFPDGPKRAARAYNDLLPSNASFLTMVKWRNCCAVARARYCRDNV